MMHKKGKSAIYDLASLIAKEQFRLQTIEVAKNVNFTRAVDHHTIMPASAPHMEVWKARQSDFVSAEMSKFFTGVVVAKISANLGHWNRLSKTEGSEFIGLAVATPVGATDKGNVRLRIAQESLRSFIAHRKSGSPVNKHLSALDISDENNMAFLLKCRNENAQNFAILSVGLTQAGKDMSESWKSEMTALDTKLSMYHRFEDVSAIGSAMLRSTVLYDIDDASQCVIRRTDDSMSGTFSQGDEDNNSYDYEYDRMSEGTQTAIITAEEEKIPESAPACNPCNTHRRNRRSRFQAYGNPFSADVDGDDEDDSDFISALIGCHTCGGDDEKVPERCHHHTYRPKCSYCRYKHAKAGGDPYQARLQKLQAQDRIDRANYMEKINAQSTQRIALSRLSVHADTPHAAKHDASSCVACGGHKSKCDCCRGEKVCTVPTPSNNVCYTDPSCDNTWPVDPPCADPRPAIPPCNDPRPAIPPCDDTCHVDPPCNDTCRADPPVCRNLPTYRPIPPTAPECWYMEDDETSSSSEDNFCELVKPVHDASTNSTEEEHPRRKLVGVETLTYTGAPVTNDVAEQRAFAESRIVRGKEMAFLWGGKKTLPISNLDPVFAGDDAKDLNSSRVRSSGDSYTAFLALQLANKPTQKPNLDKSGQYVNDVSFVGTSSIELLLKRQGTGILDNLKNFFSSPLLKRVVNDSLLPVNDQAGVLTYGVRVFDRLNDAVRAADVPTKAHFMQQQYTVTGRSTRVSILSGRSFQLNVDLPGPKNSGAEMYFLTMDTTVEPRHSRRGSASTAKNAHIWYRPETHNQVGLIMVFTPNPNPEASRLYAVYAVYPRRILIDREISSAFRGK